MRITYNGFACALTSELVRRGIMEVESRKRFDKGCAAAAEWLRAQEGLNVRFRIRLHWYAEESTTVQDRIIPFLLSARMAHFRVPFDGMLYFSDADYVKNWITRRPKWREYIGPMTDVFLEAYDA